MNDLIAIKEVLETELSSRLASYSADIAAGSLTREEANLRYLALQTAAYTTGTTTQRPAIMHPPEVVRDELNRWKSELTKTITYENKYDVGRKVEIINKVLSLL